MESSAHGSERQAHRCDVGVINPVYSTPGFKTVCSAFSSYPGLVDRTPPLFLFSLLIPKANSRVFADQNKSNL